MVRGCRKGGCNERGCRIEVIRDCWGWRVWKGGECVEEGWLREATANN